MAENEKLDLMKKFKELNVAEYTTKYGDYYGLMFAGAEIATKELQKENAELKAQISVLLSCKNCTENKCGYICEKEYNDKCLAQKIQYIKELEQESAECKKKLGNIQIYLAYKIPHELINEATSKIWKML